jgi:hypothetical protein
MIKQDWNINDNERFRILNLHESATKNLYLINEQNQSAPFTVDFGNTFESGQYKFNPAYQKKVTDNVQKISNYIKTNKLKDYKIVITPSESQVPNQDPFQKPKSLADARGQYLKTQLETLLTPLLNSVPNIEVSPSLLGDVPWDTAKGKDNEEYKKDQFVRASVVLVPKKEPVSDKEPYERESIVGEQIYMNGILVGFISQPFVKTTDVNVIGDQPLNYQNLIFTEVKKDTQPPQIVAKYNIPWEWWNSQRDISGTKHITSKDLEKIRTFEKAV